MRSYRVANHRLCQVAFLAVLLATTSGKTTAGEWEATTTELLNAEKKGLGYGGLCGVFVDHASGDVLIDLSDKGLFRSTDQGKSWKPMAPMPIKGRTETPGCFLRDPTGKSTRLVMALVYGNPIGVSVDDGATWKWMDKKSSHVDWCAVDWSDPDLKFVLTLAHESGGLLRVSRDGGKSFEDIGKGYGPAWIFDGKTAVAVEAKTKDRPAARLVRTTDGGKTFKECGGHGSSVLPKWHNETLYWLTDHALIATTDKGESWKEFGKIKNGRYGPIFGKDEKNLFVLTGAGIVESKDGGATWEQPIVLPKDLKSVGNLSWFDYDPKNDVLYAMKMSSELYKLQRGK